MKISKKAWWGIAAGVGAWAAYRTMKGQSVIPGNPLNATTSTTSTPLSTTASIPAPVGPGTTSQVDSLSKLRGFTRTRIY